MREDVRKRLGKLFLKMRRGDFDSLAEIQELAGKSLYALANCFYKTKEDVEDAVQDFYVELFEKSAFFKRNDNAVAWMYKVFKNYALTNLKRRKREIKCYEKMAVLFDEKALGTAPDYNENYILIKEIFNKLTPSEAELFVLYYWFGLSYLEISKTVGKSKSTISDRFKNIKERLRIEFSEQQDDGYIKKLIRKGKINLAKITSGSQFYNGINNEN